jgi:hypothetical protein
MCILRSLCLAPAVQKGACIYLEVTTWTSKSGLVAQEYHSYWDGAPSTVTSVWKVALKKRHAILYQFRSITDVQSRKRFSTFIKAILQPQLKALAVPHNFN